MRSLLTTSLAWPLFLALGIVHAGESEAPIPNSLEGMIAKAIESNPGLLAEYERSQAALERIPQAKALPDPRVTATHFVQPIETRTGPQRQQVFLMQTVPWFGKLRLRGEVASEEADAIYHGYESSLLRLARELATMYYDYAYLGKATAITANIVDLLKQQRETVDQKVRAGGDLAELLRLEVELGKAQDQLQELRKARISESSALAAMLGVQSRTPIPWPSLVSPRTSAEGHAELVAELIAENPELKALRSRILKADHAVQLSKRSPIPDPTIGVGVFNTGDALNSGTFGSGDDPWAVQLSFSVPLWSRKYKAEKAEALANYQAAKQTLSNRENELVAELEMGLQKLAETEERVELYSETLLPKARQAVELIRKSYEADNASILDFIDTERSLLEIEKNYWRAVADHYQSFVRIRTLTGHAY